MFSSVKCCRSQFRREVLTYCSSYGDNQCDYAEGCLSANSKACSSLLHLLSFTCSQLLMFKMSIDSLKGKVTHRKPRVELGGPSLFRHSEESDAWGFVIII